MPLHAFMVVSVMVVYLCLLRLEACGGGVRLRERHPRIRLGFDKARGVNAKGACIISSRDVRTNAAHRGRARHERRAVCPARPISRRISSTAAHKFNSRGPPLGTMVDEKWQLLQANLTGLQRIIMINFQKNSAHTFNKQSMHADTNAKGL